MQPNTLNCFTMVYGCTKLQMDHIVDCFSWRTIQNVDSCIHNFSPKFVGAVPYLLSYFVLSPLSYNFFFQLLHFPREYCELSLKSNGFAKIKKWLINKLSSMISSKYLHLTSTFAFLQEL